MNINILGSTNQIAYLEEAIEPIVDGQAALDLFMSIAYETGLRKIVLKKTVFSEAFFDLKTKLLGEVMQKAVNYHLQVAIIGEFSQYNSKSLNDLIVECNRGRQFFLLDNLDQAILKLDSLSER